MEGSGCRNLWQFGGQNIPTTVPEMAMNKTIATSDAYVRDITDDDMGGNCESPENLASMETSIQAHSNAHFQ